MIYYTIYLRNKCDIAYLIYWKRPDFGLNTGRGGIIFRVGAAVQSGPNLPGRIV